MPDQIDAEIEAIKSVLKALEPLPPSTRSTVITYVCGRLEIPLGERQRAPLFADPALAAAPASSQHGGVVDAGAAITHIKQLKEQKKPRSANEMAALVAYFLAEVAPIKDRKDRITAKDVETYFKIAGFPLTKTQFTLPNAKAAGYLDPAGSGEYKLNAVGHNLVVHNLPRGDGASAPRKAVRRATPTKRSGKTKKR